MAGRKINYSNIGVAGGDQTIGGDFLVGCTTTELQNPIIHKTKVQNAHNSQVGVSEDTLTNQTHQPQAEADKTQSHSIRVFVGDRKIKVSLPIGRCTGKDLKCKLKDVIDNIEDAIFKERDEDGDMVEILDSDDLSSIGKIFVEFKQTTNELSNQIFVTSSKLKFRITLPNNKNTVKDLKNKIKEDYPSIENIDETTFYVLHKKDVKFQLHEDKKLVNKEEVYFNDANRLK